MLNPLLILIREQKNRHITSFRQSLLHVNVNGHMDGILPCHLLGERGLSQ